MVPDRSNHSGNEFFRRNIFYLFFRKVLCHLVANSLHKMSFAQSHSPINKKRVVNCSRIFRNGPSGGVRKFVKRPYHKVFKSITGVEIGFPVDLKFLKFQLVSFWRASRRLFFRLGMIYCVLSFFNSFIKVMQSFKNDLIIFIFQPFFGKVIRDSNNHQTIFFSKNFSIFEPSSKTGLGNIKLDLGKSCLPKFFIVHIFTFLL